MITNQRGFTLVETFIALAVGVALFAGVLSVFVGMRTTSKEASSYGELQENGRFALSVLSDDLLKQNFWGDYSGVLDRSILGSVPAAPANECVGGGINNGTFPLAVGHFRTLWGVTVNAAAMMNCIDDAKSSSDILQLKRAIANPLSASDTNNYYILSNLTEAEIFTGSTIPVLSSSQLWEYQHHIYYIRDELQGTNTIPVLMQGRLTNQMTFSPIIDGIEVIRFMYGVDMDAPGSAGYGIADVYVSSDNMTDTQWDNGNNNRILSVRIFVLARGILPDSGYTNNNTYNLGGREYTFNDNYRRLLFSSTVTLYNSGVDSW